MRRLLVNLSLLIWMILPAMTLFWLSVSQVRPYPEITTRFTLQHWLALFESTGNLKQAFLLSFVLALVLAILSSFTGFFFSFLFRNKVESTVQFAYMPFALPPVLFGILLQFFAIKLGIAGTLTGVALIQLLFLIPFAFILFVPVWTQELKMSLFLAETLGASNVQIHIKIMWPLIKQWFIMVFLQCAIISWFEYGLTRWIGVGKVQTLPVLVLQYIMEGNPFLGAVAALVLVMPVLGIFFWKKTLLLRTP